MAISAHPSRCAVRLALAGLLLSCTAARAEPPEPVALARAGAADAHRPVGIVLSGGLSLGAYEAGLLHGILSGLRADRVRPRVLTGTSAGGINAFIGALEACSPPTRRPTESLLYRAWIPMGLDRLFRPHEVTRTAAFSRGAFTEVVDMLRERFVSGLDERCEIALGFAVTRERPRQMPLDGLGATVPRMTERILVQLRGHGPGKLPSLVNASTAAIGRHHLLLPLDGPSATPFDSVVGAILSSAAFPLAFAAQRVPHCSVEVSPGSKSLRACTPEGARSSGFIDGGFFDNQPIGLALSALRDLADATVDPLLFFVDPSLRTWPPPLDEELRQGHGSPFSVVLGTLVDFIDTARSAELERLLAHDPSISRSLRLGRMAYPAASESLGAFFGFVDVELRRFDFYLGLFHARRLRAHALGLAPSALSADGDPADPAWRPLACLRALFDEDGEVEALCAGPELADFRAIARHMIERVAQDCAEAGEAGPTSAHPVCLAIARGAPLARVPGVDGGEGVVHGDKLPRYRRRTNESASAWTLRRLAELGFRFRDLGLGRAQAHRAPVVLRAKLGEISDALAARQGALGSHLYRVIGDVGLNFISYVPPRHLVSLLLGNRLELGWSYTEPASRWRGVRLEAALGLWGLESLFSDGARYFGLAPMVGVRLEPLPLSRSLLQPRLSLRAGFLFSTTDRLLARGCEVLAQTPCSRPIAEAALSVALISILRLELSAVWMPAIRPGERERWSLSPGIALQLPFGRLRR